MASIPKKVSERIVKNIGKFQQILRVAKDKDLNESDTVAIISDIFAEIFGYEKYIDITSEHAIRGTYCDLAIKLDGKIQFLVEAKAVGVALKENHLRQAVDYGAKAGAQWIVLTNGITWEIYKIRFEQPISYDMVCSFDLLGTNYRKDEDQVKLFVLCKEGLSKKAREDYFEKVESVNSFVLGALILNDVFVDKMRRELKKIAPGVKIDNREISKILSSEVLKRDIIDGEGASRAKSRIKRHFTKKPQKNDNKTQPPEIN